MSEKVTIGNCTLYHGDCIEVMQSLPPVDMVLCDLPFGITKNKWDIPIPFDELWEAYDKLTIPTTAIVQFASGKFKIALASSNLKDYRYDLVWEKSIVAGFLDAKIRPLRNHEHILVFSKNKTIYNPQMIHGKPYKKVCKADRSQNYDKVRANTTNNSSGLRYPKSILKFANGNHKSLHPTQKPVDLLAYLIKTYSHEGHIVLDNAMGVGSTGVACIETGRHFIGIEKDKKYFDLACERIADAVKLK